MWNVISLGTIWTRVTVSISYDDNHYTTDTSAFYRYVIKTQKMTHCIEIFVSMSTTESTTGTLISLFLQFDKFDPTAVYKYLAI